MRAAQTTTISVLALSLLAGSAVAVAAQDEEATTEPNSPVIVTGNQLGGGRPVQEPEATMVDGVRQERGLVVTGDRFEADDPRMTGSLSIAGNADFRTVGGTPAILISYTLRIENEEGSWSGPCDFLAVPDDGRPDPFSCLFSGEGAYDGLSAYLVFENPEQPPFPFQGLIFEGELPPTPERPPAE